MNKIFLIFTLSLHISNANQFQFLEKIADSSDIVVLFKVKESNYTETYKYLKDGSKINTKTGFEIIGYPEKIIKGNDIFSKTHTTKVTWSNKTIYFYDSLGNIYSHGWIDRKIKRSGEEYSILPDSCYLLFLDIGTYNNDTTISLNRADIKERVCALKSLIEKMSDIKSYCKCAPGILTGETTAEEEIEKLNKQLEEMKKRLKERIHAQKTTGGKTGHQPAKCASLKAGQRTWPRR
jgi:hypothetical protein